VDLTGVGAAAWSDTQDEGGLFRACTRDICMELQSSTLPLLVPSPNAALGVEGRDRWLPTPTVRGTLSDTAVREQYKFMGALMGAAARGASFMELDLAPAVWKKILGETLTVDDLSNFDERIVQYLNNLVAMSEAEWDAALVRWRIRNAAGRIVVLSPAGSDEASNLVPFTQRDEYIAAALALRLGEFDEPIAQIKAGLGEVVPVRNGMGLMGWRELEQRVCGEPRIDLDLLKSITKYDGEYRRQGASHPVIAMFWRVMQGMSEQVCKIEMTQPPAWMLVISGCHGTVPYMPTCLATWLTGDLTLRLWQERAAVVGFAWGRSRLPAAAAATALSFNIDASHGGDDFIPTSSTCDFRFVHRALRYSCIALLISAVVANHMCAGAVCRLHLPQYSCDEALKAKLLYACSVPSQRPAVEIQRSLEYGLGNEDEEVLHGTPDGHCSKPDSTAHYVPLWVRTALSNATKSNSETTVVPIQSSETPGSSGSPEDTQEAQMRSEVQRLLRAELRPPDLGWPPGTLVVVGNDAEPAFLGFQRVGESIPVVSSVTSMELHVEIRTAEEEEEQGLRAFVLHADVSGPGEPRYIVAWDRRRLRGQFADETDWEDRRGVASVPQTCVRLHALNTDFSLAAGDGLELQVAELYERLGDRHKEAIHRTSEAMGTGDSTHLHVFLQQVQMEPEDGVYCYYQSVKHSLDVQTLCPDAPLHELLTDDMVADAEEAIDAAQAVSIFLLLLPPPRRRRCRRCYTTLIDVEEDELTLDVPCRRGEKSSAERHLVLHWALLAVGLLARVAPLTRATPLARATKMTMTRSLNTVATCILVKRESGMMLAAMRTTETELHSERTRGSARLGGGTGQSPI
jgi:hypothetical protein